MQPPERLVVLGMNLTALAVARSARRRGLEPWLVDVEPGPASKSRVATCVLDRSQSRASLLRSVASRQDGRDAWLVSTSDTWNHEIVSNRDALERAFTRILQPSNDVLATCLSKTRFARWCEAYGVPAPRQYRFDAESWRVTDDIAFPVFVRPDETRHGRPAAGVAKASVVASEEALAACLETFRRAGVVPSISESLLGRELQQISVGVAIDADRTMAMVARKVRPLAQACRVGTLVETVDDEASEALAVGTMRAMGYEGIGEVEILRDVSADRLYVIEINARPWIQFALAEAAGRDLLGLFLTDRRDVRRERQRKRVWLDFSTDIWNCFNGDDGLVRRHQLSIGQYVKSLLRADVYARWAANDPWPFLADSVALSGSILRALRRRPGSRAC